MKDANLIAAAVKQLNPKDDTQWDPDGSPKLELIQRLMNDATVTVDDVQEAIGPYKRTDKKLLVVQNKDDGAKLAAKPDATTPAEASAATVPEEPPLNMLDPDGPEYAERVMRAARAEDAKLQAAIGDCERQREVLNDQIRKLTALRDVQVVLIERYAPRVTHAQAVKSIQAQTQRTLADQRSRMTTATQILGPHGTPVNYPSKLDAAMALRKRTPEQTANHAKFMHQTAAANAPPPV